jgi:DNA topoisomerase-3
MLRLVQHFGDRQDSGAPCGICDQCAPSDCLVTSFGEPAGAEIEVLAATLDLLRDRNGLTTGQLHKQTGEGGGLDRNRYECLLDGLVRSGLVEVNADSFVKDGRTIRFQRVWLTRAGGLAATDELRRVPVVEEIKAPSAKRRASGGGKRKTKKTAAPAGRAETPLDGAEHLLFEALREWRLSEARKHRTPAFRIVSDQTVAAICRAKPSDLEELLEVPGIGPAKMRKYGRKILAIVNAGSSEDDSSA